MYQLQNGSTFFQHKLREYSALLAAVGTGIQTAWKISFLASAAFVHSAIKRCLIN
jgi:hypothetical protein